MKKRIVSMLRAVFLLVSATACAKQPDTDATQADLSKVDVDYSYNLALKLEEICSNEKLGYRTAGSEAELATGDMLKEEMERIGLQDVTKDAFTLDTWTFTKAQLCFEDGAGEEYVAELGGYQTNFVTDGAETFTVIDGGQGTEADLAGLGLRRGKRRCAQCPGYLRALRCAGIFHEPHGRCAAQSCDGRKRGSQRDAGCGQPRGDGWHFL